MDINNWDRFLKELKGSHQIHAATVERAKKAKTQLDFKRKDAGSYLELLGTNTFVDPKDGFKVWVRRYMKVKVTDKKAFMMWLKTNCSPSEVIEFLCPPNTTATLKKFVEKKYAENKQDLDFRIDGIDAETSTVIVKTSYLNEED